MCNIIVLKRDQMPVRTEFDNMCYNNWHSYGLVTKIGGKLDIVRKVPKSGEIDPEEIWKLLERDVEYERILHVRHNTAGATDLLNCHPFDVYYNESTGRHVCFMHNGTLYEYKSKKWTDDYKQVDDPDGPSDSKNFANEVLQEIFSRNGGDLEDKFAQKVLGKFWVGGNRGILISSDQESKVIGDWKKKKDENDKEYLSSNDEYFGTVKRGPEFDRREEERKRIASEAKNSKVEKDNGRVIEPLSNFRIGYKHGFYALKEKLANIVNDWNIWDREGATMLGYASREELESLYDADKKDCITVMDWVFTDYAQLYKEYLELKEKHDKATNMIADLKRAA